MACTATGLIRSAGSEAAEPTSTRSPARWVSQPAAPGAGRAEPDAYLPNLAMSVNNLPVDLTEAGRRAEALAAAQEAVELYRELVALNRDARAGAAKKRSSHA
jgi:hypothetical protein